jgi:hypothetical protein
MVRFTPDRLSQIIAFVAVAFGVVALVLSCIGIATPNWYEGYTATANGYYTTSTANFWYSCIYSALDGSYTSCTNRNNTLSGYPVLEGAGGWEYDYYQRMQNAGALCIVGILFLFFGTLGTLIMGLVYLPAWPNVVPPALLFIASLFMVAGLSEGSRFLTYRGYAANLYQSGQVITSFTLLLSTLAAGRINFSRTAKVGGKYTAL